MMTWKTGLVVAVLAAAPAACGGGGDEGDGGGGAGGGGGVTCSQTEYIAFDPAYHAPQDARLARIDEMLAKFAEAKADPTTAAAAAAEVLGMYTATDTNLAAKVAGRQDFHFTGAEAEVGAGIDAAIRDGIERLRTATSDHDVSLAKQVFEKAGFQRWLYLSVMQELAEPSEEHYDEAYGYLGSGPTNAEAGRRSLVLLATKRDGNNQTTLASELFALLLDGRCELERALAERGADEMPLDGDDAYRSVVERMDAKLQVAFAYSVGHELFELDAERADAAEAAVKLFEGEGFFRTLEPYLAEAGGEDAQLGAELRTAFSDALAKVAAGDDSWLAPFPAVELLERLEASYGIDVKG